MANVRTTEFDIKDCYPSVDGESLPAFSRSRPKFCRKVLAGGYLNVSEGSSFTHAFGCEDDEWVACATQRRAQKAQRGIPQGSAASPFITEALLAPAIDSIPKHGVIVAYADNILLLAKSKDDVVSMSNTLWSALKAHPAGPFQPKAKHFQAGGPIDFLGHRLTMSNGSVRIDPTPQNTAKFTKAMGSKLHRLEAATLMPTETGLEESDKLRKEILSWTDCAFKTSAATSRR